MHSKFAAKIGPEFYREGLSCPDSSVVEQASGWQTASYVAYLIPEDAIVVDLTAGAGINSLYFSRKARKVIAVEIDPSRADSLRENVRLLGIDNLEVLTGSCLEILPKIKDSLDLAYIDPARRDGTGRRSFFLEDYSPRLDEVIPLLEGKVEKILIKLSPMLDLTSVKKAIPSVSVFHILESHREVKELIAEIGNSAENLDSDKVKIKCIILDDKDEASIYDVTETTDSPIKYIEDQSKFKSGGYVYEPSPAIMKAGRFGFISRKFPSLYKLSDNTHLFYGEDYIPSFPGRIFKILKEITARDLKIMKGEAWNVISRNHPASAPELASRYKFKSSETNFIIAARTTKDKVIMACEKKIADKNL